MVDTPSLPYRQGSLDGLCGIYAIINAIGLVVGDDAFDPTELFRVLIRRAKGRIGSVIVDGMNQHDFEPYLKGACAYLTTCNLKISYSKPSDTTVPLRDLWAAIDAHLGGTPQRSVVLGMVGACEHWTCVRRIDAERLHLLDSGDMTTLSRSRLSVRFAGRRRICLDASRTYLLAAG